MMPPEEAERARRVFAGETVRYPDTYVVPPTTPPADREVMLYARALSASRDPGVRRLALWVRARAAGDLGRAPSATELVQAVTDAQHELIEYAPDPPGVEVFNSVQWTLGNGLGSRVSPITERLMGRADCEDLADSACAMGIALGLDMRPKWWDQDGAPQNHVSGTWLAAGRVITVETTLPGARVGETPQEASWRLGPDAMLRVFGRAAA